MASAVMSAALAVTGFAEAVTEGAAGLTAVIEDTAVENEASEEATGGNYDAVIDEVLKIAEAVLKEDSADKEAETEAADALSQEPVTEEAALLQEPVTEEAEDEYEYEDIFAEWNEDAPALQTLIDYVETVTDETSEDFIPEEDRIAVFDMDGTLCGELYPTYLEYYMLAWRILKDPRIQPDAEMLAVGRELRESVINKSFAEDMPIRHAIQAARAYSGMTLDEFDDFVTEILLRDVDGFEGMTYGEAIYLPMIEVIEYLHDNGFQTYICSGSDRFICRTLFEGIAEVPDENIIGMDVALVATGQNGEDGLDYVFTTDDAVIRSDQLLIKNLKMNKVAQIAQEIGRQPVLSFGNSSGDVSMHNYTISNNPYKSAAFMLIADDEERDYGNTQKGQELREKWEASGYNVISMKDDFRTIYGDNVVKTGTFHWAEELADDRVLPEETEKETEAVVKEPAATPAPAPTPATEAAPAPTPATETAPAPTPATEAAVETEAPAETEAAVETEAPAETEAAVETEAPAETEAAVETEAPAETEAAETPEEQPEPAPEAQTEAAEAPEPAPEVQTEAAEAPEPAPEAQTEAAEVPEPAPEAQTEAAEAPEPAPEAQTEAAETPAEQPESAAEEKPEAQTSAEGTEIRPIGAEYQVTGDALNVRMEPNADSDVMGLLLYGDEVEVIGAVAVDGAENGWYQIRFENTEAYAYSGFLTEVTGE